MRTFTTSGVCIPKRNYMVSRANTLDKIMAMMGQGKYLILSRPRQFGKTTLLAQLEQRLSPDFDVITISLQGLDRAFESSFTFSTAICTKLVRLGRYGGLKIPRDILLRVQKIAAQEENANLQGLIGLFTDWCFEAGKPVVLVFDEVDEAAGSMVFRKFLGILRDAYLERNQKGIPAFQSVILCGVSDVEHLRQGIHPEGESTGTGSPWNIASNLLFPLDLPTDGIQQMLMEYEADHHTGMDTLAVAKAITRWTSGYPYLVSRICEILDSEMGESFLGDVWTADVVDEAAVKITKEENSLFSSLIEKARDYPSLAQDLTDHMFRGKYAEYNPDNDAQKSMLLYGFVRVVGTHLEIANEIFRIRLARFFDNAYREKNAKIMAELFDTKFNKYELPDGTLDVYHLLEDFIRVFTKVRRDTHLTEEEAEKKFVEEDGRRMFMLYLSPIIGGSGTYTIEEQTLSKRRMDLVIHFRGKRYVIELKTWHGAFNPEGEEQLIGYLDEYDLTVGYMLRFCFNKAKEIGITSHSVGGKIIHEAIV